MKIIEVLKNNGTAGGYMIQIGEDAAIFQRDELTSAGDNPLTYSERIIVAFCEDWVARSAPTGRPR